MDRGNWWDKFFKDRKNAIDDLDLFYRRKWNKIDWINGKVYDDTIGDDKWGKAIRLLNDRASSMAYPYYHIYYKRPEENDYRNWHNIEFSKEEVENELLKVFKAYPKYSAHIEEGIRNDELFQNMVALLGFMQDVGAYYGVVRTGYDISNDVIEAYITGDKNRYSSIVTQVITKQDEVFSKLYDFKNIDSDIDDILNLKDKEEMKKKIKELTLSHCRTIFDKDNESIIELKRAAENCIKIFRDENMEVLKLASMISSEDENHKDNTIFAIEKMLSDFK